MNKVMKDIEEAMAGIDIVPEGLLLQ